MYSSHLICVEFEAAKYVPTNCEWLIARTKMEISFINYHWLSKWKISYNLRSETSLNKRLLRNSVNIILCLTNAILFIIAVTKIVANGHELWRLANRKMLSGVKKLVKAMMGKGIPLPEWCLKNCRRKEPFAAKEKEKDQISRK